MSTQNDKGKYPPSTDSFDRAPKKIHKGTASGGQREKPLAIKGTLDDVLRAAMRVKPKDEQVRAEK